LSLPSHWLLKLLLCVVQTVAESMLRRGQIDFLRGSVLSVSQVTSEDNPPAEAQDNPASGSVELSSIPPGTKKDTLFMFLESRRRCDGGPVKCLEYDASRQTATVTFEDSQSKFCISVNRSQHIEAPERRRHVGGQGNIWGQRHKCGGQLFTLYPSIHPFIDTP